MRATTLIVPLFAFALSLVAPACSCDEPGGTPIDDVTPDAGSTDADCQGADCIPDPCDDIACRPDQVCVTELGVSNCRCPAGTQQDGETCVPDTVCTETTCSSAGDCTNTDDGPVCTCEVGYAGDACETCDGANGWQPDGMGGCTDDPCVGVACGDRVCVVEDGQGVCQCPDGTHDDDGACVPDTECMPDSCNGNGTCDDSNGNVQCSCDTGWDGEFCSECDALAGYHPDGMGGCTDDPCLPNPCGDPNQGVCVPDGQVFTCECDPGYHLEGSNCVVDQVCEPDSCSMNGVCDDSGGVIACSCDPGYAGDTCDACDAAAGFHPDGMGGCTDDPCLPNPCMAPNKGVCVTNGSGYICECDPGFDPDGSGGCFDDPCNPDPCGPNEACRIDANDQAECYVPTCDDGSACTTDAFVNGGCVYTPITCDDGNVCTADSCDPAVGCETTPLNGPAPDADGISCTQDSCVNGFLTHTPDDAACDDGAYCNGEELCRPQDAGADADGCVTQNVPSPPADPSPCESYGACDEGTDTFPLVAAPVGTTCDDGNFCTTGDACDASGQCRGTSAAQCPPDTCTSTSSLPSTINLSQASISVNVTLDGQPLQTTGTDTASHNIYAVAHDTGVRHNIAYWYWSNGLWDFYADRLIPGRYDIIYVKGETSRDSGYVSRTASSDIAPRGVRYLARDVDIYAGTNTLDVDIPTTSISVDVTMGGQPLQTTGTDTASHNIYAVSKDTGIRHNIAYWYWSNGLWDFYADRLVSGTYDIIYVKGETSRDSGYVSRTAASDLSPRGVRYLARDVVVSGSSSSIAVDIPVTSVTVDITLGGQPLQTTGTDTASHNIYAVSKDTGIRHNIAYWYWSNGLWDFYTDRLVSGTYDIIYVKGETSRDSGYVSRTAASDLAPRGVRYLARDVVVSGASDTIAVDIPVTAVTVDVTMGGQPLPDTGTDTASHNLYAVSKDTGIRHNIAYWYWSNGLWDFYTDRLPSGTYDIIYLKGETSRDSGYVSRTVASDIAPRGVAYLARDVVVSGPSDTIAVDLPQSSITVDITMDGQPLQTTGTDTASHNIYAVSKETGVRHNIAYWYWSNGLWDFYAERLIPGTYDLVYVKGETSRDSGYVSRTSPSDIAPRGVSILARDVVVGPGASTIAVDLPQAPLNFGLSLDGQPLQMTGTDTASHNIYAVSRETGVQHNIAYWYWSNGLWDFYADRLIPGTYDIIYRKGETSRDSGYVSRTAASDLAPRGVRYLGACFDVQ